jgi:hypothetical protein
MSSLFIKRLLILFEINQQKSTKGNKFLYNHSIPEYKINVLID